MQAVGQTDYVEGLVAVHGQHDAKRTSLYKQRRGRLDKILERERGHVPGKRPTLLWRQGVFGIEGRIADYRVKTKRRRIIPYIAQLYKDTVGKGTAICITACLQSGIGLYVKPCDMSFWNTLCGHQGYQTRAGTDVENPWPTHLSPGTQHNAIGTHLLGTFVVIDTKLLEIEIW